MNSSTFETYLRNEPELQSLADAERKSLVDRLNYLLEMCDKIHALKSRTEDVVEALNEIELDAWVNVGAPEEYGQPHISSWQVRVAWAQELGSVDLLSLLPPSIQKQQSPLYGFSSLQNAVEWISEQGDAIRELVERLFTTREYAHCIAHLIALDLLVLNLLSAMSWTRLTFASTRT